MKGKIKIVIGQYSDESMATETVEIDGVRVKDNDMIDELMISIQYADVLFTDAAKQKINSKKQEMLLRLEEIRDFINNPSNYIN